MSTNLNINDIVQIVGPRGTKKLNLLGKVVDRKFRNVGEVEECYNITIIIDRRRIEKKVDIFEIDIENVKLLVNQDLAKYVYYLQMMPLSCVSIFLNILPIDKIFYIYKVLQNPYINHIIDYNNIIYKNNQVFINFYLTKFDIHPVIRDDEYKKFKVYRSNNVNKLIDLTLLTPGYSFNEPLGISLHSLTNLRHLEFSSNFNQTLGSSLNTCINLEYLIFGYDFNNGNQPLGDSLHALSNLKTLSFNSSFDNAKQPLGNSLTGLTNLVNFSLKKSQFNQPLGDSLKSLINLKNLTFGHNFTNGDYFTHEILPLGDSLSTLVNLENLTFGQYFGLYQKQLGNSLHNLKNLKSLDLGHNFNHRPELIGNSFAGLTNLITLRLGYHYNSPLILGNILNGVINIKEINSRPISYDKTYNVFKYGHLH
jgi:hypothetical protein